MVGPPRLAVQQRLLGNEPLEAGECCKWDWMVGLPSGLLEAKLAAG